MNSIVETGVSAVRNALGLWVRDTHTLVRFEGNDVATWLQSQTSNDVVALRSGQGHANTVLDRKGRLQAHFTLHRWQDEYWLIVEKLQAPRLLEHLDAHLFIEEVRMADAGGELEQVLVQGPRTLHFLSTLRDAGGANTPDMLPSAMYGCHPIELCGFQVLAFRVTETGEDGYLLVAQRGEAAPLRDAMLEAGAPFGAYEIGTEAQDVLRIEAGIPRFGVDMDATNRMPETTLEREAVSYDKGCYLGQEVIAKLRAYSSVKLALVGLALERGAFPPRNAALELDGNEIGVMKSAAFSPTLGKHIALAYLDRNHRAPGTLLELYGRTRTGTDEHGHGDKRPAEFAARVVVLPFYAAPARSERARALYDEALRRFDRDALDEDGSAIELLREAVLLDPAFEDAYEALGVILNRHHRVDEAIHFMQILGRLNPDSVMAHTNLSVFYVAKGMIPEAEEEKAKAAVLQMKHARQAREAEDIAATERDRIRREATERIAMFREVLEFDPDDPLATFGTGMAYVQLNDHGSALPFLERAVLTQKDYSAAYLNLGKCLEFLRRTDEARAAYTAGIECASRKGDLMPLREMERRLKAISV